MEKSMKETKAYLLLESRKSKYLTEIDVACDYAETMLTQNMKIFDTYTVHSIQHSINVAEYMYELIDNPNTFSDLEITMILYAALFHDIGMGVTQDEIDKIKSEQLILGNRKYSRVLKKYKNEHIALQECIRPVHAQRSAQHIRSFVKKELFLIPGASIVSFQEEIAKICQAHNEDFLWLKTNLSSDIRKGHERANPQFIAILLRLGDYLDIDEQRAPLYLYEYLHPNEYSDLEWRQHFCIDNFDKIAKNEKSGLKEVYFCGQSDDPSVHRKLLKYFDSVNRELCSAVALSETYEDPKYLLHLRTNVVNRLRTEGFSISDVRLTLDYKAVTDLLMGEHIYGSPRYGLREIIQNSIDACKTMEETAEEMDEYRVRKYEPFIVISLDQDRNTVSVLDNGSGMTLDILRKYFLNVGISYYRSDDYLLQGRSYLPIGHYGIGFLACFMLSNTVRVITKHISETKAIRVEFERNSEYICLIEEELPRQQGTEIVFEYAPFMKVFGNTESVANFINENFVNSGIPIKIVTQQAGASQTLECKLKSLPEIAPDSLCLSDYLNGIEAFVDCNYKGINFSNTMADLSGFICNYYNAEENSIILEDEDLRDIRQFIRQGTIEMISCYVIDPSEAGDFKKAYDILEDYEESLEKIDSYYVVAFIPDKTDDLFLLGEEIISQNDELIIGDFHFSMFCRICGHSSMVPTMVKRCSYNVVSNNDTKYVLPYHSDDYFGGEYGIFHKDKTYMKGVFLPRTAIKLPYIADGIGLKSAVINITEGDFFPTVSRDNISSEMQEILGYAIGKALHLWILDHAELTAEQRSLLRDFIKTCYPEGNSCLREETSTSWT